MRAAHLCAVGVLSSFLSSGPLLEGGIVFDFRAPNLAAEGSVENQTFNAINNNTLKVTTTGHMIGGTPAQNANANAYRTVWGLGVQNLNDPAGDLSTFFNKIHVDGKDPEFIRLEFSAPVRLQTVVFQYAGAGSTDRFGLVVDGNPVNIPAILGTNVIKDLAPPGLAPGVVRFPLGVPAGRTFDFLAANWGGVAFDEWNLEKVEVVPEPESIFTFALVGLAIIAAWQAPWRRLAPAVK